MKKNKLLSCLCALFAFMAVGSFASCSNDGESSSSDVPNSSIETPDDSSVETPDDSSSEKPDDNPTETVIANVPEKFELKLSAIDDTTKAAAYYLNGVTASKGEESVAVAVDLSEVDFTKAGEYEITYSVADSSVTETSPLGFEKVGFFLPSYQALRKFRAKEAGFVPPETLFGRR